MRLDPTYRKRFVDRDSWIFKKFGNLINHSRVYGVLTAIFCLIAIDVCAQTPQSSKIVFVGTYYSERSTEEHQYRKQADLWRDGQRIFGLWTDISGMQGGGGSPTITPVDGTINSATGALQLSNYFRGTLSATILRGAFQGEPRSEQLKKSTDQLETHPESAPITTYAEWLVWAKESAYQAVTSSADFRNRSEVCREGDGSACRDIAQKVADYRPLEATRFKEQACQLKDWMSCRDLGKKDRAEALLLQLCRPGGEASYEKNSACGELGDMATKSGDKPAALRWYKIGCNDKDFPDGNCSKIKKLQGISVKGAKQ